MEWSGVDDFANVTSTHPRTLITDQMKVLLNYVGQIRI